MSDVTILAPSPTLTVTVEDHPQGSEIHVHAGGQGVWQARMLRRLGVSVTMCCVLSGEIGRTLRHLLEDEEITVVAVEREGRGSAYVHDRREGQRNVIAEEEGDAIGRHEQDDLYGAVLRSSAESTAVLLSGPAGDATVPADIYRRLAIDLRGEGRSVIADLAGERLRAVVEGGIDVLKVSHEELRSDGLVREPSVPEITHAMQHLREQGAGAVIVTRASEPLLLLDEHGVIEVSLPRFEENETRGAGDSLTAGVVAALIRGESLRDAVSLGAAAGALNVTRHGLGTGDAEAIVQLRESVQVRELPQFDADAEMPQGRVSPDGLAALAETEEP
ncbi:1-phosphofructokinase family hexose kinase [Microbacterium murale]|uniref:1-phosphofructokinase n=1 Tax=Microbacterium murale TaxID=1081040 RepID=A0ABU0PAE5_9MICO|nr:PfkB family carbohydrate kinase [Microbacterium murale]MDQ0644305.1 1-phosphofructokinase [Microbacterium murale]